MPQDTFVATPTLVIGLGGSGLKVATFVKKSLLEVNRNQSPERVAILVLDTEKEIKFKAGGWGRERSQYHATGPVTIAGGEYVPLTGDVKSLGVALRNEQLEAAADPRVRRAQAHRHISSWFQAQYYIEEAGVDDAVWNLDVGAGQYRQLGRLGLFSHVDKLRDVLSNVLAAVRRMGANALYVHVVGSLVGGTGAAMFADVAHMVKELAPLANFTQSPVVFGHFILTEGFRGTPAVQLADAGVRAQFDARCYAALREMTRLQGTTIARTDGYPLVYNPEGTGALNSRLRKAPYTAVYLYDGIRPNNELNTRQIEEGLAPAIADAIVAYVDERSGGAFCSHSVNYQAFYPAYGLPAGQVTYGSVGTYTIELPIYHITEGWVHGLAQEALDKLLAPRDKDPSTQIPLSLDPGQPGGTASDAPAAAINWLRTKNTALVAQLADWGLLATSSTSLRQQAVEQSLALNAAEWQQRLAPADPAWQVHVANAQNDLDGNLKDPKSLKYFVDYNQPGQSDEERANALQNEVEARLKKMIGEMREVWLREGGDFRRSLVRLGNHHVESLDQALEKWLQQTLNGDPNVGTPVDRKQGKLGYVKAFLEQVDSVLKSSAAVLTQAQAESELKRKTRYYDILERDRKLTAAEMRKEGGFRGSKRRAYRDKSDELAQFQKADIARQVAFDLLARLQISIEQALQEVGLWERILATAKLSEGGAYALVVEGQKDVAMDRARSKNAARWGIDDNESGDTYISTKHEQYERDGLGDILHAVEWTVGRKDDGSLRVDFTLDGAPWDRLAGAAGQQVRGARNVSALLDRARSVYEAAWSDMSVTDYLIQNYSLRIDELARKVYEKSGYMLSRRDPLKEPPMRTAFLRVYKQGLETSDTSFLAQLRTAVAQEFHESTTAQQRANAAQGSDYVVDSGQDSYDRFKLTFVMFGDLLRPEEIAGYAGARSNYQGVSGRGSNWKVLQVLPAETNALEIERTLSSGPQATQQRRRELSESVVAVLEDIERFRLAMRCLAYGETDYDWGLGGERGLLLHRYTPPLEGNPAGRSYWRLTLKPEGVRRADGYFYKENGDRALPEHYQLTPMADRPDLLQAFVQLVCAGRDSRSAADIDWDRVENTLLYIMERHRQQWSERSDRGWAPLEAIARNPQLLSEAQSKAAQIIRLRALTAEADGELVKHRWAWAPAGVRPVEVKNEDVTAIQNYVDLYTALRRVAEEERENLRIRFAQLAAWTGSIPEEKITLHSDVAMDGGEDLAAPEQVLVEGGWTCASCGHHNTAEVSFCEECGGKRPEAQVAAPMPPEKRLCENGHEMPPEAAFCPRCGKPEKPSAAPRVRLCENGHELPPEAAFCPRCGKPEKRPEEPQLRLCENGHEMPPEAAFCPKCGKPEKRPEEPKLRLCENGHEMRPNARFCSKCGRPARA